MWSAKWSHCQWQENFFLATAIHLRSRKRSSNKNQYHQQITEGLNNKNRLQNLQDTSYDSKQGQNHKGRVVLHCIQISMWAMPSKLHRGDSPTPPQTNNRTYKRPTNLWNITPHAPTIRKKLHNSQKDTRICEALLIKKHVQEGSQLINNQKTFDFLNLFWTCFTASILTAAHFSGIKGVFCVFNVTTDEDTMKCWNVFDNIYFESIQIVQA